MIFGSRREKTRSLYWSVRFKFAPTHGRRSRDLRDQCGRILNFLPARRSTLYGNTIVRMNHPAIRTASIVAGEARAAPRHKRIHTENRRLHQLPPPNDPYYICVHDLFLFRGVLHSMRCPVSSEHRLSKPLKYRLTAMVGPAGLEPATTPL